VLEAESVARSMDTTTGSHSGLVASRSPLRELAWLGANDLSRCEAVAWWD
jgi:hypothetical protein